MAFVDPAEIAIAWIIARPSITVPIASATSLDQLRTLLTATRVSLDRDTIAALNAASA
jgi:aryl-alcohol dehydrogenase-like predicted oxidoreductase